MKIIMKILIVFLATAVFAHQTDPVGSGDLIQLRDDFRPEGEGTANSINTTRTDSFAGVALGPPPPDTAYYAVIGSLIVPTLKPPTTGPGTWAGQAWVGIDGWYGQNSLFQAGIGWALVVAENGTVSPYFQSFTTWQPDSGEPTYFNDTFIINPGDIITILCETNSTHYGKRTIQDRNSGVEVSLESQAPGNTSQFDLKGQYASWVVQDEEGFPLADFGQVEWFDCQAAAKPVNGTAGNTTMSTPGDAVQHTTMINSSNQTLVSVTASGQNITVTYNDADNGTVLE
jgi:hypothetical protein